MSEQSLIPDLVAAIKRLNAAGDSWGWPGVEIANIAVRRWEGYSRRHKKSKRTTHDDRVLDVAKGLQTHFEPEVPYTHPSDWRALAAALAEVLRATRD